MFDNKVNLKITPDSIEILKSKSGVVYKIFLFILITIVFLILHFTSLIEFTSPLYFNILVLLVIAVNFTYIILIRFFRLNDVKFDKINSIVYFNGEQVLKTNNLKIINYEILSANKSSMYLKTREKKSSLYLKVNEKNKNLVFSSDPDDVKAIALKLSEFLNIKVENHYSSFYPIW